MSERVENLGRREELRRDRLRLVAKCEALRDSLRGLMPIASDVADIDCDKMLNTAVALDQGLAELARINKQLAILNRELGE